MRLACAFVAALTLAGCAPSDGDRGDGAGPGKARAASIPKMAGPPGPAWAASPFAANPLWDDGKAEFSVYKGEIQRYGERRTVSAKIIVVKEDLNDALRVKSEAGPQAGRTTSVLKLNYVQDFDTGMYSYHQMASTFFERSTLEVRKLAMTSNEACGITYVEVLPGPKGWRHVSHSYWDGEGDRNLVIAPPEGIPAVPWDGLVLWLRALDLDSPQRFEIALLPSQVANRVLHTAFVRATVEVTPVPDVGSTAGGPVVDVSYTGSDGKAREDMFVFAEEPPHVLRWFRRDDFSFTLQLVKTQRIAYWEKNHPGDEKLLDP